MLDTIGPHAAENIWHKLKNAPEGEADPMSFEEEQELSHVAKTNPSNVDLFFICPKNAFRHESGNCKSRSRFKN